MTNVATEPIADSIGSQIVGSFAHPLTLLCVGGWLVNDHVLKVRFANVVTGKLSDVFGLVVFPMVVAAIIPVAARHRIWLGLVFTTLFFVSINTSAFADGSTEKVLGVFLPEARLTRDASDLVTLPAIFGAWWLWRNPIRIARRSVARIGRSVFGLAVVATLATSAPETTSAPAISRVEVIDDRFVALHQVMLLEGYAPYAVVDGVTPPDGYDHVVYESADGVSWQISSIDPGAIDWTASFDACSDGTCWSIAENGDGRIVGADGTLVFTPEEQPPDCLVSRWRFPGDCSSRRGVAGPLDLVADAASGRAVAALGTEGVAVWDGTRWSQLNVDTPRPRTFWEKRQAMLALSLLFAMSLVPLGLLTRAGRLRRLAREGQRT